MQAEPSRRPCYIGVMSRFFAQVFAVILAAAVFAGAVALLVNLRAESPGGWAFIAALWAAGLVLPFVIYRVILSPFGAGAPPNEGEGAGLAMGAGMDAAQRRNGDDIDPFSD